MNSKKILSVFLVLLMTLSLVACNSKKNNTTNNDNETIVQETQTKQEEVATTEEVSKEEATIVVQEEVKEESKEKDRSNYSYWVNFLNPDGSVIERKAYKYGETPTYPSNPTYKDNRAIYEFIGWDKKLSPVTMTQNYAAVYNVAAYLSNPGSIGNTLSLSLVNNHFNISSSNVSLLSYSHLAYEDGMTWTQLLNENNLYISLKINGVQYDNVEIELSSDDESSPDDEKMLVTSLNNYHYWVYILSSKNTIGDEGDGQYMIRGGDLVSDSYVFVVQPNQE